MGAAAESHFRLKDCFLPRRTWSLSIGATLKVTVLEDKQKRAHVNLFLSVIIHRAALHHPWFKSLSVVQISFRGLNFLKTSSVLLSRRFLVFFCRILCL